MRVPNAQRPPYRGAPYYHSGASREDLFDILNKERARGLITVEEALRSSVQKCLRSYPNVPIALDTGFSLTANHQCPKPGPDTYERLLHKLGDRFDWYTTADYGGAMGQASTDANTHMLRQRGFKPMWVYQIGCEKPPEHILDRTDFALGRGQRGLIGIGGLVPLLQRRQLGAVREKIEACAEHLNAAGLKAHFFGLGSPSILSDYADEPWFASADSMRWLTGYRARLIYTEDGEDIRAQDTGLLISRKECTRINVRAINRWSGCNRSHLNRSS